MHWCTMNYSGVHWNTLQYTPILCSAHIISWWFSFMPHKYYINLWQPLYFRSSLSHGAINDDGAVWDRLLMNDFLVQLFLFCVSLLDLLGYWIMPTLGIDYVCRQNTVHCTLNRDKLAKGVQINHTWLNSLILDWYGWQISFWFFCSESYKSFA